ncbi:hypothetical protein D9619_012058 [Psilocybe cf. subviscida]|uniref:Uncharacterized protein n=1 Tax=Psilocybe cf. subviscida TaxID=2480587 RepID=A0A8H5B8R5_9AGAR|nr:hypothetical protein D9619_012058 [Psilocybe cf. subviscida]
MPGQPEIMKSHMHICKNMSETEAICQKVPHGLHKALYMRNLKLSPTGASHLFQSGTILPEPIPRSRHSSSSTLSILYQRTRERIMSSASIFVPPPHFNFAKRSGMISVPAASVFAVIYLPLLCWFILLWLRNPTNALCAPTVRIPSFVIRAMLAGNWHFAAENLGLVVADQVLFGVGFFGLLYSAYILVLDRRNRTLFRALLSAAVLLSIVGASMATPTRSVTTDHKLLALRQASTSIFFVLTVLQAALMLRLVFMELRDLANHISRAGLQSAATNFGSRYTMPLLIAVTSLLLIRQTFAMVTVNDSVTQNKENYWYPLITVPELLAVLLYAIPGLVPRTTQPEGSKEQQDIETQNSSSRTQSRLSFSSNGVDQEGSRPRRRGSDETQVDNLASTSEKQRGSRWDSTSDVDTVVVVSSEKEYMPDKDAISEKKEQSNYNAKSDAGGSQHEILPVSKFVAANNSV